MSVNTPYQNAAIAAGVTDSMVRELVFGFYEKVRRDPSLAPIFMGIVGEDWGPHLERLCVFWSSLVLPGRIYKRSNVTPAHIRHLTIRADQLPQWLHLFGEAANEICPPDAAAIFIHIAAGIAESLKLSLDARDQAAIGVGPLPDREMKPMTR